MEAPVDVERVGGVVRLRCRFCQRVSNVAIAGFQALVESLNAFLRAHRHSNGP